MEDWLWAEVRSLHSTGNVEKFVEYANSGSARKKRFFIPAIGVDNHVGDDAATCAPRTG